MIFKSEAHERDVARDLRPTGASVKKNSIMPDRVKKQQTREISTAMTPVSILVTCCANGMMMWLWTENTESLEEKLVTHVEIQS